MNVMELEQHIQEFDTNKDKKRMINEKISEAKKEQEFFISLFPRPEIRNIDILDYVQGKSEGKNKTFAYLMEFGSKTFGKIGGASALKFVVYYSKTKQNFDYSDQFKSHTEAYSSTINLIADCLDHTKNFIETKDWKLFSDHITELVESKNGTPSIAVISKIIAMYYPDEFIRMWSHQWLNNTLDAFQIERQDLPEGQKEGKFYEKMERLMKIKNSHPIMKKWSNEYFSYSIGEYLVSKDEIKKNESHLLNFLKFKMNMKQNYQPIVIKMLLENPNHTITIQDIRKKFDELNFDRGNFVSSTGKPMGNSAIDVVKKSQVKKYVKFPEGTSNGNVTLIEKTYDESTKDECLKICGQRIAKHHIEKIAKEGFTIWGTKPGDRDSDYEYLDEFLETNSIGCGWNKFGDLSKYSQKSDAWEFIRQEYPEEIKKQTATTFSHDVKKKDIIVLTKGQSEIIDFGIVISDYEYVPKDEKESYSHRRRVVWLKRGSIKKEELPDGLMLGMMATINPVRDPERIDSMIDILLEEKMETKEYLSSDDEVSTLNSSKYEQILKFNKNLILYGPPGTGKTYQAEEIAAYLINLNRAEGLPFTFKKAAEFILSKNNKPMTVNDIAKQITEQNLVDSNGETPDRTLSTEFGRDRTDDSNSTFIQLNDGRYTLRNNNFIKKVTFHPSYSYEDFVEGFRPNVDNKTSQPYILDDGIFKEICDVAKNDLENNYVLLIDEINRGNIPKIFGELITVIENGYRGPEYQRALAYSKNKDNFYVPKNLYIIGTMNTADKSLVQMDEALRRRFVFEELMPEPDLLETENRPGKKYKDILENINKKIIEDGRIKQFRDRQIGHSYFWPDPFGDKQMRLVIKYQIIPLLQDYFYDDYEEIKRILGSKIIGPDNRPGKILDEGNESELIRELRSHLNNKKETTDAAKNPDDELN